MNRPRLTMQYGGNQQQRILNMMMQARQQQQQVARSTGASMYGPGYSGFQRNAAPAGLRQQQQRLGMPQRPTELPYVTSLTENDVLLGRGTPCAENEGNVRFRRLVRQHKAGYIAAEKRIRKDAIAREILDIIASRGGKFLRKVETKNELIRLGVPPGISFKDVWARVDEDTQVQKVKQALRNKDDAGELPPPSESEKAAAARGSGLGGQTVTNELPRGVKDEGNVHRADCNIQFGTGALERASSGSGEQEEKLSSRMVKRYDLKGGVNSPASTIKKTTDVSSKLSPRRTGPILPLGGRRLSGISDTAQAQQKRLVEPGGITDSMLHRDAWDKSKAAPTEGELRTLQELQRLRMMREQMGVNPALLGGAGGLSSAGVGGLDGTGGMYGANYRGLANAEYRQMQAQRLQAQQLQAQRMAAASFCGANIPSVTGAIGAPLRPSLAMAARQPYMESQSFQRRMSTGSMGGKLIQDKQGPGRGLDPAGAIDTSHPYDAAESPSSESAFGRTGADSAGERAIGIAQAMKRAEAFPPAESLELSHLETIILLTLSSRGLPVWSPDAETKSFVDVPAFAAKRFDWTWCDFASLLRQNARQAKSSPESVRQAGLAAAEYLADPRELATKTVMLIEKVRRHSSAGTTQRKQWSGLGMRVPLWLDRELSRWAMSLGVADPTGRPMPFSVTDFASEHPGCKEDPSVMATAAFDPQLADDIVDQVALLTRLRSLFAKSKPSDLSYKMEAAVKEVDSIGDGWQDQPKGWEHSEGREVLLCDRLLRSGFTGVTSSVSELSSDFQLATPGSPRSSNSSSFESMGLTKSAIQQRLNQVTRELHIQDEAREMQGLLGSRMERIAQTVLRSTGGSVEKTLKKRRASSIGSDSSKKAKK